MKKNFILVRIEPEVKEKLLQICKAEARTMTSLVLYLIYKKIEEMENGKRIRVRRIRGKKQKRIKPAGRNNYKNAKNHEGT
jgi:predicted DNA-binding protein